VQHGAGVVIADIDDLAGENLAASLGPHVSFVHCDVSEESNIEHVVAHAITCHGKLDILCNNAGVLGRQTRVAKSIMSFDADEFDRVMRVNVRGSALGIKHAARVMVPSGTGCVISIASAAGVLGGLGPHAYTASKHAVVGITRYELLVVFFYALYFCPLNLHIYIERTFYFVLKQFFLHLCK
jgi:NAD(P)-dependent dehydrogenase (short-subunit alcohol dehydrogenase family)